MAIEDRVLTYAEEVEYMKELARQTAQQLLDQTNAREIIDDPAAFVERLLAVLLAEVGPLATRLATTASDYAADIGLQSLDDAALADIIAESESRFFAFAQPALTDAVETLVARVHDMIGAGVDLTTIDAALSSSAIQAALIAPLIGVAKRMVASWIQFVARDVNDAAIHAVDVGDTPGEDPGALKLTWVAVMDRNTCGETEDPVEHYCRPRHGQARTLVEWTGLGLPGSPVLECSLHAHRGASPCRCFLSTDETAAAITKPIVAGAAVKRGRDRAVADAAAAKNGAP